MGPRERDARDDDLGGSAKRQPRRARPQAPRKGDVARIFVAAYPPGPVVDALRAAVAELDALPAHRPTPRDQIHLTAQFVGDVDPRDLDGVIETVERAAAGIAPFEVAIDRLITLPERGPARLIAAAAPEIGALSTLHERLSKRLARRAGGRATFLPHLTLLRFRSPVAGLCLDVPTEVAPFVVSSIVVVRSNLRPEGADHRVVAEVTL